MLKCYSESLLLTVQILGHFALQNAKIQGKLIFDVPGLLKANPQFTIEAFEVDGLDRDLVGRATYTLADTFREDDGDRVIHKRIHINYDGLFAGAIELVIDQINDDDEVTKPGSFRAYAVRMSVWRVICWSFLLLCH